MFNSDSVWEFKISDRIKFGLNAVQELGSDIKNFPGEKVVIFADQGIKKAGILDYVKDIIKDFDFAVFDDIEADPSLNTFKKAVAFSKENGGEIMIGLGGGSPIDVAKVVSIIAKYGGTVEDYIAPPIGKGKPIIGSGYPMIAIPTTSGTGSEVSPASVLTLTDRDLKVGISSQMQRPNLAIVDPLLTVSAPPKVTASTGIDALCHAIESYTTKKYWHKPKPGDPKSRPIYGGTTVFTDLFAEKAIELIANNLREAYNNGENIEARTNMALASIMAGISFTNAGLGAVHAMSFPLGGKFHVPHGVANAILLPVVMEFNAKGNFKAFKKIAELMGECIEGLPDREAALKSAKAVEELCKDVGIPNISEFGVKEADLPQMAADTMKIQRLLSGNPRRVSEQDILSILKNALSS
jgi:alcohol dehydrogenase class IV